MPTLTIPYNVVLDSALIHFGEASEGKFGQGQISNWN